MKYQRLTEREAPLVMTLWEATKVYNRLIELENKIESGELVDRDEYIDRLMTAKDISGMTDKELEFFAKHNARVRENAEAELSRLTEENDMLKKEVDNLSHENGELENQNERLEFELTSVTNESFGSIEQLKAENAELRAA